MNLHIGQVKEDLLLCKSLDQLLWLRWGGHEPKKIRGVFGGIDICIGQANTGELQCALDDLDYISTCVRYGGTEDSQQT